jgi:hypothetical protein
LPQLCGVDLAVLAEPTPKGGAAITHSVEMNFEKKSLFGARQNINQGLQGLIITVISGPTVFVCVLRIHG